MSPLQIIFKRELAGYFATPLAYVFIVIFLVMNGIFTFDLGGFYVRGQADLMPFFSFHPWLYLFMIPAIAMGLWADERKTGTIELLMTLPITLRDAVLDNPQQHLLSPVRPRHRLGQALARLQDTVDELQHTLNQRGALA